MKTDKTVMILAVAILGTMLHSASAQSINLWRGNEIGADWNESYKWTLNHPPTGSEAIHFRKQNSVISINSTIELENGMHLYGKELLLEGNGNINLRSSIPYQRTIAIPASSSGRANLTLTDNLSVKAQISLAAKAFGTSASKGSLTLKDRSTISGDLLIGNNGNGSGHIILRNQSTYHITRLELDTLASHGGSAEIHILGGTVRIDVGDDPFGIFLADTSRKIIIGDNGTLHIESNLPIELKKKQLEKMIAQKQLVSARDCTLGAPVVRDDMILLKAAGFGSRAGLADSPGNPKEASDTRNTPSTPATGFIVFVSALLLLALRPLDPEALVVRKESARPSGKNECGAKSSLSKSRENAA